MADEAEPIAPAEPAAAAAEPAAEPAKPEGAATLLGDAKPEGEAEADKDKAPEEAKEEDAKPEGAPEAYEAFTAPEGMALDEQAIEAFTPIAKELNLNQAGAQKLVDLFAAQRQREAEASAEQVKAMRTGWVESAKTDKEIGGAKFDENLGAAKRSLEAFGTKQLVEALDETGLGDHPEVIRFFARVGRTLAEDKTIPAKSAAATRDSATILYPPK